MRKKSLTYVLNIILLVVINIKVFSFSGVGFATRQVGNRTKPNLVVCVDDQGLICMKSQSTFKTTEIKFKLNESFEEITADDRKTTVCYGIGGIFAVV